LQPEFDCVYEVLKSHKGDEVELAGHCLVYIEESKNENESQPRREVVNVPTHVAARVHSDWYYSVVQRYVRRQGVEM